MRFEDAMTKAKLDVARNSQVCCSVYETNNYSIFKALEYNRDVTGARVAKLIASFSEKEIINPIVVNEKMEIIDGQGRFEALKKLNRKIKFIVSYGANIDDCRRMNVYNTNWSTKDFVQSYVNAGNGNYIRFSQCKDITQMSWTLILRYANKASHCRNERGTPNDWTTNIINSGNLVFTEEDMNRVLHDANCAYQVVNTLALEGKPKDVFYHAFKIVVEAEKYNHERMLKNCKKCRSSFSQIADLDGMLKEFSRIYNYSIQAKDRLYFEDYMRNRGYKTRDYSTQVIDGALGKVSAKTLPSS